MTDPARSRLNRNNAARGKRTSRDLAEYLGWQNVETLGLPWDVQGWRGEGRLQSKRLADAPSLPERVKLIEYIDLPPSGLRGLFVVAARQRLASGEVWVLLEEWVGEHGWTLPPCLLQVCGGRALIRLDLPTFREWQGGVAGAA